MKLLTAISVVGVLLGATVTGQAQEVALSALEFQKLDTFEGHELAKADKVFAAKDYRSAAAAYEAFLIQYPKSSATPYAVLRKARCLQLGNKRFEAIKAYTEVLDYFPNAVNYAAPALYFIGACHLENGNLEESIKAWSEMARDADYRKHYLAAGALVGLAGNLLKQGKTIEAVAFYEQAALDFRTSNPAVVSEAISQILLIRIRILPDQAKLRDFYDKAGGFGGNPGKPEDGKYWDHIRGSIRQLGSFADTQSKERDKYYRYWADAMEGKFASWDDFQIDLANFRRVYETDNGKWTARLDKQFSAHQKPDDFNRIVKWILLFAGQKPKVQEYYAKLDFAKMTNPQIQDLMHVLFTRVGDAAMAKNVFGKIRFDKLTDAEKVQLARSLWNYHDDALVELAYRPMTNLESSRLELLRYYNYRRNAGKGLPLANEVIKVPAQAKEGYWIKGELLQHAGKHADAILAYQAADNPPVNLWRIVDCLLALQKRDQAVAQLREIENFFQDQAPAAALRIAYLFRDDKKQFVKLLRGILKKYPKSGQSSTAHQELEALGVPIGGGLDAE